MGAPVCAMVCVTSPDDSSIRARPEVEELGLAVLIDQNIAGLDVAVDYQASMGARDGGADREE